MSARDAAGYGAVIVMFGALLIWAVEILVGAA